MIHREKLSPELFKAYIGPFPWLRGADGIVFLRLNRHQRGLQVLVRVVLLRHVLLC